MPLRIGETFAGYRVLRMLGSGGMGEVYLVQHPRLPRHEALKVLRPDFSTDPSFRERFIREADLAAGLRHPHIVGIHDRGEDDGQLWIAMDYVDGVDASHLMEQKYPAGMPIDTVELILKSVASALDYAHKRGLLHRDVKPANIIVADPYGDDPAVFLADFGIARPVDDTSGITTTNMTLGTVAYAAPEQLMGDAINGRADQYALAATTYHLLTGTQLFPHSNPAVVISRHLNAPTPALADARPDFAALDSALAIALAKDRDERFASCMDFARAISDHAAPSTTQGASQDLTRVASSPLKQLGPGNAHAATACDIATRSASRGLAPATSPTQETSADVGLRRRRISPAFSALLVAMVVLGSGLALWHPWANPGNQKPEPGPTPNAATTTSPLTSARAIPPSVSTTTSPPPPPTTTTTTTTLPTAQTSSTEDPQDDWREHNTWVCDTATGEVCGNWTPDKVAFACKAVFSGADYTAGLKNMLMSRFGMGDTDAFFLGKEAMYSISSGGYINTGGNADGAHPLCTGIVP